MDPNNSNTNNVDPPAAPVDAPSVLSTAVTPGTTPPASPDAPVVTSNEPKPYDWVPDKYHVKNEAGELDLEATAKKLAEAHGHLEKRLGSGDAPPKTPEEYAPAIPEVFDEATLKADPMYQDFLKGAHEQKFTNEQVSWILSQYGDRSIAQGNVTADECIGTLKSVWNSDQDYSGNMQAVGRTMRAYGDTNAEAVGSYARLEAKYGNDPDFLVFSARIGAELKEDKPASQSTVDAKAWDDELKSLQANPAFGDPKHPDHAALMAKKSQLYKQRYG